jgi:ankyrin repeat protein
LIYGNNVDPVLAFLASSGLLFTPGLDGSECPPLVAVNGGDLHAVQTLISLGFDVNQAAGYEWAALHAAAQEGREVTVDALLRADASVNTWTRQRLQALKPYEEDWSHFFLPSGSSPRAGDLVNLTPSSLLASLVYFGKRSFGRNGTSYCELMRSSGSLF